MFVELVTDTTGAAFELLALTQQNILDCRRDPSLFDWIGGLLSDPLGIVYGRESPDVWTSAAAERWREQERAAGRLGRRARLPDSRMERHRGAHRSALAGLGGSKEKHRIRQDCEDIAAEIGCWAYLSGQFWLVRVAVTQPHGDGVSHAYNELVPHARRAAWEAGKYSGIVDGAAYYGMRSRRSGLPPPLSWYRQGRTVMFDVTEPRPSVVI